MPNTQTSTFEGQGHDTCKTGPPPFADVGLSVCL
jgi:hypothetical protein